MPPKRAYLLVVVGTLVAYGGVLRSYSSMGTLELVLLWGLVAIIGVFLLMFGARRIIVDLGDPPQANPDGALRKTDSRVQRP